MEYNILGLTDNGKTKFLSELFSGWIDESNRKKCQTFSKEQVDYLIPLYNQKIIILFIQALFRHILIGKEEIINYIEYNGSQIYLGFLIFIYKTKLWNTK